MPLTLSGSGTIGGLSAGGLPDGTIQQADLATGVAGTGPAFSAYQSSAQSIADVTETKIVFNTEVLDSASCFDPATSRFTPTVAGWYFILASISAASSASTYANVLLRKNGAIAARGLTSSTAGAYLGISVSAMLYFNGTTDYVEAFFFHDGAGAVNTTTGAEHTYFQGFLARAA